MTSQRGSASANSSPGCCEVQRQKVNHLLGRFLLPPSSAPLLLEVDIVVVTNYSLFAVGVVVVVDLMFLLIQLWSDRDFVGSER